MAAGGMMQMKQFFCRNPARVLVMVFLVLIIMGSWYLTSSNPKSELLLLNHAEIPRSRNEVYGPHLENKNLQKASVHQNRLRADFAPNSYNKHTEDMERVTEIRAAKKASQLEAHQSKISNDKDEQIEGQEVEGEEFHEQDQVTELKKHTKDQRNEINKEIKKVEDGEDHRRADHNGEINSEDEKLKEVSEGKESQKDSEHELQSLRKETEEQNDVDEKDIGNSHDNQVEEDIKEEPVLMNQNSISKVRPKIYNEGKGRQSHGHAALETEGQVGNKEKASLSADDNRTKGKKHSARIALGRYENNVLIPLVKVSQNNQLVERFKACVTSICQHTSINLSFHIVADENSWLAAQQIFGELEAKCQKQFKVKRHDVQQIANKLQPVIKKLRELFVTEKSYYYDPVFFMTAAIHLALPTNMSRVIILDSDLEFRSDIKGLFDMFSQFAPANIMGLAYEQQPIYRHILYKYRERHKGTKLGDPPPDGIPGFNSGVVLMNLQSMRRAHVYNLLLSGTSVKKMTQKYLFRSHLGDQDFFSLISFEHRELFYIIPCSWNRQLCKFWEPGYTEVFDAYYSCRKPVHVYHGNCRTPIPRD